MSGSENCQPKEENESAISYECFKSKNVTWSTNSVTVMNL